MPSTKGSKTAGETSGTAAKPTTTTSGSTADAADTTTAGSGAESPDTDVVDAAFQDMQDKGEVVPPGAVRVRYTGRASVRNFRESDFRYHGVTDQGPVAFTKDNRWIAPVSQAASDFLLRQPLREFVAFTEEDEAKLEEREAEPPRQRVPAFGVEPKAGGVAVAVTPTPDSV